MSLFLPTAPARAEEYRIDPDGQVDKSKFPEITIRFRIVDAAGKPVKNLAEQEIIVWEDGEEVFRQSQRLETDAVSIALVIDTSGSMWFPADRKQLRQVPDGGFSGDPTAPPPWRTKMEDAKQAAERFLLRLDPRTPCGLIFFNHHPWMVEPIRLSRERLFQLVRSVAVDRLGATAINEAVDSAIKLLLTAEPNLPRTIVIMTDGKEESKSQRTLDDVINAARENRIRVFPIGFGEAEPLTLGDQEISADLDEAALKRLAEETGGQYYHVREADKLSGVFERVAGQLQDSYAVTFRSRRDFHDGTSRGIDIKFGKLAVGKLGYTTHGLITPMRDHGLYIGLLAAIGVLLAMPGLLRRRSRTLSEPAA